MSMEKSLFLWTVLIKKDVCCIGDVRVGDKPILKPTRFWEIFVLWYLLLIAHHSMVS